MDIKRQEQEQDATSWSERFDKDEPAVKSKKKPRVLVEVEHEDTGARQKTVQ
ncbi:MAK16-like protein [Pyrus ussuriensis x Pyrus communis]|uniref:MAK16-like protein n=1 Tax=Pyrus ussuriensis x Pyrus communis TaxID=2448454 RepID=A0A5N5G5R6_9ROSA|nr:MAK16-like protein [Pyrus ussuriensis x Pyrus communis]